MIRISFSGKSGSCEFECDPTDGIVVRRAFGIVWDLICRDRGVPHSLATPDPEAPLRGYLEAAIRQWEFEVRAASQNPPDYEHVERAERMLDAFKRAHRELVMRQEQEGPKS